MPSFYPAGVSRLSPQKPSLLEETHERPGGTGFVEVGPVFQPEVGKQNRLPRLGAGVRHLGWGGAM